MKTLLTIDWDAFIPEPSDADIGHSESLIFRDLVWGTRGHLKPVMKASRFASGFFDGVFLPKEESTFISDSHLEAYNILTEHEPERVILVDQHHDLWPSREENQVCCASWLRQGIKDGIVKEVVWHLPAFSHCTPLSEDFSCILEAFDVPLKIKTMWDWERDKGDSNPDLVHVCRSSCWTPPWLDAEFRDFCKPLQPCKILGMKENGAWNPFDIRADDTEAHDSAFAALVTGGPEAFYRARNEMSEKWVEWIKVCGEHAHLDL